MKSCLYIIKMELYLYIKSLWLWLGILLLSAYLAFGYYIFFIKDGLGSGQILQSSAYIVMACVLFGMVAGIIAARREKEVKFEEVILTFPSYTKYQIAKLISMTIVFLFLILFQIIEVVIIYQLAGSQINNFILMTISYILIYWGITLVSGGILGYAIEKIFSSVIVYPVLFFIWILVSPYNRLFIPESLAYTLNQAEENINSLYNDFIGLNISYEILLRHVFFLIISCLFICFSILIKSKRPFFRKANIIPLSFVLVLASIATLIIPSINHKIIRDEMSITKIYTDDYSYYKNMKEVYTRNQNLYDFKVAEYDIHLMQEKETIEYSTSMDIEILNKNSEDKGWLVFTLYHGLKVSCAQIEHQNLEWKQEGDLLYIKLNKFSKTVKIDLQVRGDTGYRNFNTQSSLYLSSSFAWYPIAGYKKLFEIGPDNSIISKNVTLAKPVKFRLKVNGKGKTYSNLPCKAYNEFYGEAYGATLLYGRLLELYDNNLHIVAPPDMVEKVRQLIPKIGEAIDDTNKLFEMDAKIIPKHVFIVPLYSNCNVNLPMQYSDDQIFLDVNAFRINIQKPENQFCRPDILFSTFYWFNRYHDNDGIVPMIFPALVEQLYTEDKQARTFLTEYVKRRYTNKFTTCIELQSAVQEFINIHKGGNTKELTRIVRDWYKKANDGAVDVKTLESIINISKH